MQASNKTILVIVTAEGNVELPTTAERAILLRLVEETQTAEADRGDAA